MQTQWTPDLLLALAFLAFVCGLAMLFGRMPEKIVGAGAVINEALYLLLYRPGDNVRAQWEAMWLDLAFALVIAFAAIRYNRTWAKYAAALELLIVGTHLAIGLDLRIATYFGYWSAALLTLAVLWALLIGTVQVMVQDARARKAARQATPTP
jgi:hypothetical protein